MLRGYWVLALALVFSVTVGCGDGQLSEPACTGATQRCFCSNGEGVQTCLGESWGACECSSDGVPIDVAGIDLGSSDGSLSEIAEADASESIEGPTEDAASAGANVDSYVGAPGGDCVETTPYQYIPWVSQKLPKFATWDNNMCCGPASVAMLQAAAEHREVTATDLESLINWFDGEDSTWSARGGLCEGTDSDQVLVMLREYANRTDAVAYEPLSWCELSAELAKGDRVAIIEGDSQGTNTSATFLSGKSHWVIIERIDGATTFINDPGRSYAAQGDSRGFTTSSVRARYEARGAVAIIVPLTHTPVCETTFVPYCVGSSAREKNECGEDHLVQQCEFGCAAVSGACESCDPTAWTVACEGSNLVETNECGTRQPTSCEFGCTAGHCDGCTDATYDESTYCNGADVWGRNRCGASQLLQSCANGCASGACLTAPSFSIVATPGFGNWTPSFTPNLACSCSASTPDCYSLYRGRAVSVTGNTATLEFQKTPSGAPSTNVQFWVAVADATYPACQDTNTYVTRVTGWWNGGVLNVDVPIWPTQADFDNAPVGEQKKLFLITGGSDGTTTKRWFQKQAIVFEKVQN
ncbi:MAG: hypothetical protein AUK47_02355 [Deltaproteobacteria bacterium CG2_30_63_29]|nr:MAG: hypothetical protein AUK47_02355 [Deltaproteobacteria bacterium CG2_30_63_29]